MNRNVESHFSQVPYIDKPRSIFDRSFGHKTSFNCGTLVPFYLEQNVLPGDTFRVETSMVVRLQTLLTPIMDNMMLDTYYFFIPWRLVWSHVREFFGENTTSAWIQTTPYKMPGISAPVGGFAVGGIADHLGLPTGLNWSTTDKACPSALPFRAYALVCNEFFRDENLTDPLNIPTGDADQTGTNGDSYINDVANGGALFKVAKFHDYFSSCLPAPQKGPPVTMHMNTGQIPVISKDLSVPNAYTNTIPLRGVPNKLATSDDAGRAARNLGFVISSTGGDESYTVFTDTYDGANIPNFSTNPTFGDTGFAGFVPGNLWATANTDYGLGITVTEMRLAFQLQRYYEHLASGGSRYIEWCKEFFGAVSSDARLQRPEYLGGHRIPINIREVLNTSQSATDFLGDTGAMSVTSDKQDGFVKSFTEHGIILGCLCVRYDHSFSQGINRDWTRRTLEEQYNPVFAHLSEAPVYKYEIYANGNMNNDAVFGYNECWSSYRYKPDQISGEMRPGISNTLASWHLGDYYTESPTLSDAWIREDKSNVDRVLAVTSAVSNQFWADIYVKNIATRVMPMYSVPGLIDHL